MLPAPTRLPAERTDTRETTDAAIPDDVALSPRRTYSIGQWPSQTTEAAVHDNSSEDTQPSRWWFAASAFPMAAGTLGPVASAFSICALVRPWRQRIEPGTTIENAVFITDPVWLTVVNAVQLFIAVLANMCLLLNMARRIRFSVAQPITMVGWYISSLTLVALTATASGPLRYELDATAQAQLVWSQAFYYGIYAAVLYAIVASLMVVTFLGAWTGRYDKDFQLTTSQRTLMLQTILFLVYLLVGALVFSHIEGWAYLDAVYWADVTLFTVGFGDFAAETTLGRALLFPYALIGVISLGLVIGSIRSLALDRGKRRLDARMTEKNRRHFLRRLARKGHDDILRPITGDGGYSGDGGAYSDARSTRSTRTAHTTRSSLRMGACNTTGLTELQRREQEFNIMRRIQHDAALKRRWTAMATSGGTWLLLWLLGAYIFQVCEAPYQGWNYFDGFYLAFVSLTTIGYGDLTPISNAGRSFFVFWSLLALPTTTVLISDAGDTIAKSVSDATNAIGMITILPGERGVKRDFKTVVRVLTCGLLFPEEQDQEEAMAEDEDEDEDEDKAVLPPGLLGAAQLSRNERNTEQRERAQDAAREEEEDEEAAEEIVEGKERGRGGEEGGEGEGRGEGETTQEEQDNEEAIDDTADDMVSPADPQRTGTVPRTPSNPSIRSKQTYWRLRRRHPTWDVGEGGGSATRSRHGSSSSYGYSFGKLPSESVPRIDIPQNLPPTRAAYHLMLVDEIARVTQHMRHTPPRKYTFAEWAWFLKLIGEDERKAEMHGIATGHSVRREGGRADVSKESEAGTDGTSSQGGMDNAHTPWSWVGTRSPLMSSQEEAEWILDRLTRRLQIELRQAEEDERPVHPIAEE